MQHTGVHNTLLFDDPDAASSSYDGGLNQADIGWTTTPADADSNVAS